jgi:hypothetical protein
VSTIYDQIAKRSKEKKIPVYKIEEMAGLSKGSIGKWNTVNPSAVSLKQVADILQCSVDDLLVDVGDPK